VPSIEFSAKELKHILWAIDANKQECEGNKAAFCFGPTEREVVNKINRALPVFVVEGDNQ